ncbi:MAG: LamG domain-containing protein [Candidatus Saccharimonadales bacterium]
MGRRFHLGAWFAILAVTLVGFFSSVSAERFTGGSYIIDASVVGNSFGGDATGGSYKLTSSGGESIIGQGSGGSYKLDSGYVAQLQNSIQLTVQPGGLKFYYSLDEPSGSAVRDTSFNNASGVTVGNSTWGAGKVGGAAILNGSSQYITGQDVDITSAITVEAWVKPTASQTSRVISKASTTTDSQSVLALAANVPSFMLTIGGSPYTATGAAISSGVWTHLVGSYDGSMVRLYANGVEVGQSAATGSIATNNFAWTIGRDANAASNYFNGSVDEVKVLSRTLSAEEVKAEYDAGAAGNTAGLSFAGGIIAGISNTSNYDAAILTDSVKGYTLAVSQNQNLTKGSDTIAAVSGSIASPVTWVEGTTTGLGFTLYGTNATAVPGKWSGGAAYAAFPGTSTSYYTRTGKQAAKDVLNMRLRIGTTMSNVPGLYSNVITTLGTVTP